jgi:hypothetical protein
MGRPNKAPTSSVDRQPKRAPEAPTELDRKTKRRMLRLKRRRLDRAIDSLYSGEDRQEELIEIICECFYHDQTTKRS